MYAIKKKKCWRAMIERVMQDGNRLCCDGGGKKERKERKGRKEKKHCCVMLLCCYALKGYIYMYIEQSINLHS